MIENLGIKLEWQNASRLNFPTLGVSDAHLWWLELSLNEHQSEQALALLSDIQRDKYHRRMTPELKQAYLAGRYYLLNLLSLYARCKPEEVKLSYSRLNKPYLSEHNSQLEFNFTDTQYQGRYFGLFGFTRSKPIGVDIESRHRHIDLSQIIDRRFTESEKAFVNSEHSRETVNQDSGCKTRHVRGLSVWTRKEAYGKATGQGINFKMNQQNLVPEYSDDAKNGFNFTDSKKRDWRCLPLVLGDDFVASCVHEGHSPLAVSAFNFLKNEKN
jgi:phosphopantetheinyl transferase